MNKIDYWQKTDSASALYLQGTKAQQTLEEDIATCVAEIEELVRLGATRAKLPEGVEDRNPYDIPMSDRNAYWNVPKRFGAKYVDHAQYHDFDSCMRYKGWERVAFNNYETIELSRDTYRRLERERQGKSHYHRYDDPAGTDPQSLAGKSGPYYEQVNNN